MTNNKEIFIRVSELLDEYANKISDHKYIIKERSGSIENITKEYTVRILLAVKLRE